MTHLNVISAEQLYQTKLGEIVREVGAQMNIDVNKIQYRRPPISASSEPLLSVTVASGITYLVIPTAAFLLAKSSPSAAREILAHEFAHVLHGDEAMWKISESYAQYFQLYLLIILGLYLLQWVGLNGFMYGWPWNWQSSGASAPGLVFMILLFTQRVLDRRRRSELLADAAAANQVGVSGVSEAVQLLVSEQNKGFVTVDQASGEMTDHSGGLHPHPSFRLWHLRRLFSLEGPGPDAPPAADTGIAVSL